MSRVTNRLTCGEFGGRNAQGEPCGVPAVDGPCHRHREQVEAAARDVLNPGFEFVVPPFQRTRDKVCIVGFTNHRELAHTYDKSEWEIWGLNELYRYMPPLLFDRWFEIHGREYLEKDEDGKKHMADLANFHIPVYMQKVHADIPASVRFPKEELCEQLDSKYWTNCPAWMLGMAIAMGFKTIHLIGVDMAQDSEYYTQRTCCEHWLGFAKGRGIETWVPEESDLLKCVGLYGYDDEGSLLSRKLEGRLKWLHEQDNQRLGMIRSLEAQYGQKKAEMTSAIHMMDGAVNELKSQRKTERRDARLKELTGKVQQARADYDAMNKEYEIKSQRLRDERNQLIGGIQDVTYILRSWLTKADSLTGGNIPSQETRAMDPRTGIQAPSGDTANSIALQTVGALTEG